MTVLNEIEDANAILKYVKKDKHVRKIFLLGHSQGGVIASILAGLYPDIVDGLNFEVPKDIRQPKNLKLDKNGKPNKMNSTYRQMAKLRSVYPKNQVKVLNIIGDIGGKTDGTVPNVSSLSLKYIIGNRAKSYRVMKFTGKNARHSRLHENAQVDKALIMFLWNK